MPPLDGALKPNRLLDDARSLTTVTAPDNLTRIGGDAVFSSQGKLLRAPAGDWSGSATIARFDRPILALASLHDGSLAVAVDGSGVKIIGGKYDGKSLPLDANPSLRCIVALAFHGEDTLLVCNGSSVNVASNWRRDLMEREAAGSVWSLDLACGDATLLAAGLSYPYGIIVLPNRDEAAVCESWNSRIVKIGLRSKSEPTTILSGLPGYPARLTPRTAGGAWLSVFAPRSQLIEFVMREKAYRRAMMAEVDPEFWISPTLSSGKSFSEPMQGGALKQMGVLKPWAPTRSYGLGIALDESFEPVASLHSRAGGVRHGITSCQEISGELVMTSKGGDEIIAVSLDCIGE